MFTTKQYNKIIDKKHREFKKEDARKSKKRNSRQSKATKRGKLAEVVLVELMKKHPNVDSNSIEVEVVNEEIDEFSRIDVVLKTLSGVTVYIPVAKDLWLGTSQVDRLNVQVEKFKRGALDGIEYCYLCSEDFNDYLDKPHTKRARKIPTVKRWIKKLVEEKKLHNIETLWNHIGRL